MSRTHRNIKFARPFARKLRHMNYRRGESRALAEILDSPYTNTSNRLASFDSRIVDPWDDYDVSAFAEVYLKTKE